MRISFEKYLEIAGAYLREGYLEVDRKQVF